MERERLAREASEHHSTAIAETQRLVQEAEARANAAEDRARETTASAATLRDTAQAEADALLAEARREAEQMVAGAQKEAESLRSRGHADAERELAAIKAEVARVSKRRDGIVAQLAALKDVVSSFGQDDNHDEPEADEVSQESGDDTAEAATEE